MPQVHCQSVPELGRMPRSSQPQAWFSPPARPALSCSQWRLGPAPSQGTMVAKRVDGRTQVTHPTPSASREAPWCPLTSPGCSGQESLSFQGPGSMCPSRLPSPACSPQLCSPRGASLCSLGWSGIYVHVASLCFSRVLFIFVSLKPELLEVEGLVYWKEPRWRELTQTQALPCTGCARQLIFQSLSFLT